MATPETKPTLKAVAPAGKRIEVPIKKATGPGDDKIHTWPHPVRNEFLISIGIILLLIVWSLLGFHILWVSLLIIGTFVRGPGWNWFWFWEKWDAHKVEALTNVDLPYLLGVRDETMATIVGAAVVLGYFVAGYAGFYLFCRWVKGADFPDFMRRWGWPRFALTGFLFLNMMAVVLKMLGRHLLNLKYVMVLKTPYFSINI